VVTSWSSATDAARPPSPDLVEIDRPALVARVDAAVRGPLTLVVAPAGWGKTVLAMQWARTRGPEVACVELAPGHDERRVAELLLHAAATLSPALTREAMPDGTLADARRVLIEATAWLPDCYIVLDGVDQLEAGLRDELGDLIESVPPHVHFVVLTRADVLFPAVVARLRTRDGVAFLGPRDLAFDRDAIERLLRQVLEQPIPPEIVESLVLRTKGWPVALRYAAMAGRESTDARTAIAAFGGADSRMRAFCLEKVIAPHPDPVRRFLCETAVPERVSAPLCEQLTERSDAEAMLDMTRRFFIVDADDDEPGWWRYHPVIREVLLLELRACDASAEARLLHVAADWHISRGEVADLDLAAQYLIRAGDWPAVRTHIETFARSMHERGRVHSVLSWMTALPESLRRDDPAMIIAEAAQCTLVGDSIRAENVLRKLGDRRHLSAPQALAVATIRAVWVLGHLPPAQAIDAATEAIHLLESEPSGITYTLSGLVTTDSSEAIAGIAHAYARWFLGEPSAARQILERDLISGDTLPLPRVHRLGALALIHAWSGSLELATQYATHARSTARRALVDDHPNLVMAQLALAHVLIERGEVERAGAALDRVERLTLALPFDVPVMMLAIERAWLSSTSDGPQHVPGILDADLARTDPRPLLVARGRALAARALLARGSLASAERTLEYEAGQPFPDVSAVAFQIAIARGDLRAARQILSGFPMAQESQPRMTCQWCAAILDLVEDQVEPAIERGRAVLDEAESQGHVRLFLDAGPESVRLLHSLARAEPSPYLSALLRTAKLSSDSGTLSPREVMVLRLLADRLTYAEIADHLFISQNTVKTHAKSVYIKLDASGRREALERAQELRLI
jgi:LuxR family maltose regulon positive regulatory protein